MARTLKAEETRRPWRWRASGARGRGGGWGVGGVERRLGHFLRLLLVESADEEVEGGRVASEEERRSRRKATQLETLLTFYFFQSMEIVHNVLFPMPPTLPLLRLKLFQRFTILALCCVVLVTYDILSPSPRFTGGLGPSFNSPSMSTHAATSLERQRRVSMSNVLLDKVESISKQLNEHMFAPPGVAAMPPRPQPSAGTLARAIGGEGSGGARADALERLSRTFQAMNRKFGQHVAAENAAANAAAHAAHAAHAATNAATNAAANAAATLAAANAANTENGSGGRARVAAPLAPFMHAILTVAQEKEKDMVAANVESGRGRNVAIAPAAASPTSLLETAAASTAVPSTAASSAAASTALPRHKQLPQLPRLPQLLQLGQLGRLRQALRDHVTGALSLRLHGTDGLGPHSLPTRFVAAAPTLLSSPDAYPHSQHALCLHVLSPHSFSSTFSTRTAPHAPLHTHRPVRVAHDTTPHRYGFGGTLERAEKARAEAQTRAEATQNDWSATTDAQSDAAAMVLVAKSEATVTKKTTSTMEPTSSSFLELAARNHVARSILDRMSRRRDGREHREDRAARANTPSRQPRSSSRLQNIPSLTPSLVELKSVVPPTQRLARLRRAIGAAVDRPRRYGRSEAAAFAAVPQSLHGGGDGASAVAAVASVANTFPLVASPSSASPSLIEVRRGTRGDHAVGSRLERLKLLIETHERATAMDERRGGPARYGRHGYRDAQVALLELGNVGRDVGGKVQRSEDGKQR